MQQGRGPESDSLADLRVGTKAEHGHAGGLEEVAAIVTVAAIRAIAVMQLVQLADRKYVENPPLVVPTDIVQLYGRRTEAIIKRKRNKYDKNRKM